MASLSRDWKSKPALRGVFSSYEAKLANNRGSFSPVEFLEELHLHLLR